jgi:hypothetical protein
VQAEPLFSVSGTDVTAEYQGLLDRAGTVDEVARELGAYRVLFVPGFFSDMVIWLGDVPGTDLIRLGEYFDEQMEWLRSQGFAHVQRLDIESEDAIAANAGRVAAGIRDSAQEVILITHSKGGLDSLEALIREPELREKVRGWIAFQSPWYGSPVADWVGEKKVLGKAARTLLEKLMKGQGESLGNLTMKERRAYHDRHRAETEAVVAEIPVLSVATLKRGTLAGTIACSAFEPLRIPMKENLGLESDGVVPWESAVLAGTDYVVIDGASHLDTVRPTPCGRAISRTEMMRALLTMLARRQGPKET